MIAFFVKNMQIKYFLYTFTIVQAEKSYCINNFKM